MLSNLLRIKRVVLVHAGERTCEFVIFTLFSVVVSFLEGRPKWKISMLSFYLNGSNRSWRVLLGLRSGQGESLCI